LGLAWVPHQALWSSKFERASFKFQARLASNACAHTTCGHVVAHSAPIAAHFVLVDAHSVPIVVHSAATHFVLAHSAHAIAITAHERWSGGRGEVGGGR